MDEHIFTVDVEEYYHAENICDHVSKEIIAGLPGRVEVGTRKILDLLEAGGHKATFFVLGRVAEKNERLVREISRLGHEIASHGYEHISPSRLTLEEFERDLAQSISILSGITGKKIRGYRAASFSFPKQMERFFGVLVKHGITYDSSISYSLFRGDYRSFMRKMIFCEAQRDIREFPPSFISMGPLRLPLGGGYFRAYPYKLTYNGLISTYKERVVPPLFYIHPWELDPEQPRFKLPPVKSFRHYLNLAGTKEKLKRLLTDIKFTSIERYLEQDR